jgi:hypothetical protein
VLVFSPFFFLQASKFTSVHFGQGKTSNFYYSINS